jgi:GNAT superfamily N-acetyltransferase
MRSNYVIRAEQAPVAVLALDEICFPEDYRVNIVGALWWIVWHKKEAVGYAGLRPCQLPSNAGVGFLNRVGVVAKHRGNGLQKRLIRVRESAARSHGMTEIVTYCMGWNCASVNSLISCGYKFYRPATRYGGADAVYLRKTL